MHMFRNKLVLTTPVSDRNVLWQAQAGLFLIMRKERTSKTEGTVRRRKQGRGRNESDWCLGSL
jgi:hypothetical protein